MLHSDGEPVGQPKPAALKTDKKILDWTNKEGGRGRSAMPIPEDYDLTKNVRPAPPAVMEGQTSRICGLPPIII
jgi:hypothetical protein